MCDYSLESVKSVKAQQGASYKVTSLGYAGSRGFAAAEDCAACVPAGTLLRIEVPESMQYNHGLLAVEDAIMTRVDLSSQYTHHDAILFANGRVEKLQNFPLDTTATVLVLGDAGAPEDAGLASAPPAFAAVD